MKIISPINNVYANSYDAFINQSTDHGFDAQLLEIKTHTLYNQSYVVFQESHSEPQVYSMTIYINIFLCFKNFAVYIIKVREFSLYSYTCN